MAGLPPVLTYDEVLYFTENDLRRHDLNTEEADSSRWCLTGWMGKIVAPAVVIDSHLVFATERRGFSSPPTIRWLSPARSPGFSTTTRSPAACPRPGLATSART